jgi:hypothetical protein
MPKRGPGANGENAGDGRMSSIARRLCRLEDLESRRREQRSYADTGGYARRLLEERLERMSRCIEVARDCGEYVEPDLSVEEVTAMIHAHLEESRIRREEDERRIAAHRSMGRYPAYRF